MREELHDQTTTPDRLRRLTQCEVRRRIRFRSFPAEAVVRPSAPSSAYEAILDTAGRLNSDLISICSRGLRGFSATVLGSTSSNVLHHATIPTLVIPSEAVARARSAQRVPVVSS
ncbi:universal stress protein [Leucobacter manosquensis]|uniref:Universal stress protein n=1 Tax=Leucobacter manosquensis TaxID=2810611 RepID=A0ABS5M1T8_9MICO|nr:universal stress protein [Leucobacter manosquensis]